MPPTTVDEASRDRDHVDVRTAAHSDAAAIARIYNHHVDLGGSTFDTEHWTDQQVRSLITGSVPEVWLVARRDDLLIGWASARWYSFRQGYRFTLETAIYLDAPAIGRGVANVLQRSLEQHCRDHGMHHLVAKIVADNQRSMAFHYRHGYELVGVQKEIGHMDGGWRDVAILQKLLSQTS